MSKKFAEHHTQRILSITYTLTKEQINEPIAILWIIISPSLLFYFLGFSKKSENIVNHNYIDSASWFYSYMASSIALFGFSFYLIGRRESGFIRSFIFKKNINIYLSSFAHYKPLYYQLVLRNYILSYFSPYLWTLRT